VFTRDTDDAREQMTISAPFISSDVGAMVDLDTP